MCDLGSTVPNSDATVLVQITFISALENRAEAETNMICTITVASLLVLLCLS